MGAVVVVRNGTHSGKPGPLTVADVSKATNSTARIEATMSVSTSSDRDAAVSMNGTMSGVVDFLRGRSRVVMHVDMANLPTRNLLGTSYDTTTLVVDRHLYESINGMLGMFGGKELPPPLRGKHWAELPMGEMQQSTATTAAASSGGAVTDAPPNDSVHADATETFFPFPGSFGGNGFDPTTVLDSLRKMGATLTPLGSGTVRGDAVQRYRVEFPSQRGLDGIGMTMKTHTEIAVDSRHRLRRVEVEDATSFASGDVPMARGTTSRFTMDVFAYGVSVDVQAPSPDDVVSMEVLLRAIVPGFGAEPPSTLTRKWHVIASGTKPNWTLYEGGDKDWTCYSLDSGAGAPIGGIVMSGAQSDIEGRQASCTQGAPTAALLGTAGTDGEVLIGVAPAGATVEVTTKAGRATVLSHDGVFVWHGAPGAATGVTVRMHGQPDVTCRRMVPPAPRRTGSTTPAFVMPAFWTCDGFGGAFSQVSSSVSISHSSTETTAP